MTANKHTFTCHFIKQGRMKTLIFFNGMQYSVPDFISCFPIMKCHFDYFYDRCVRWHPRHCVCAVKHFTDWLLYASLCTISLFLFVFFSLVLCTLFQPRPSYLQVHVFFFFPAISTSPDIPLWLIEDSKLLTGVIVNGCLFRCPLRLSGAPRLSNSVRLSHTCNPNEDRNYRKWMALFWGCCMKMYILYRYLNL